MFLFSNIISQEAYILIKVTDGAEEREFATTHRFKGMLSCVFLYLPCYLRHIYIEFGNQRGERTL